MAVGVGVSVAASSIPLTTMIRSPPLFYTHGPPPAAHGPLRTPTRPARKRSVTGTSSTRRPKRSGRCVLECNMLLSTGPRTSTVAGLTQLP
jgi:hypothetical protein